MYIDDKIKIGLLGAGAGIFGELAFLAVNGSRAFIAKADLIDCVREAHQYNNNFVFYVAAGGVAGALFGMWHYSRGFWSIPKSKERKED